MTQPYLIWSGEWCSWYRPNSHGYTNDLFQAGVFTHQRHPNEEKRERHVLYDEVRHDLMTQRAELFASLARSYELEAQLIASISPEIKP